MDKEKMLVDSYKGQKHASPLDYTFMCLTTVGDCLEEEPRESKAVAAKTTSSKDQKKAVNAIRLSNNLLSHWTGFIDTINKLVEVPQDIEWIDLSFNDIIHIDNCLLQFTKLKVLYLHGNGIEKIGEVDKLSSLTQLRTLTLHGNPIEESQSAYRQYVLSRLPNLKHLDFSGVTKSDRASCAVRSPKRKS